MPLSFVSLFRSPSYRLSRIRISRIALFYRIYSRLYRLLSNPSCMLNVQQSFGRKETEPNPCPLNLDPSLCFCFLRWQGFPSFGLYRRDTVLL